jgi:hypothetical protein
MKDAFEAVAYSNNATHQALAVLTKCLVNNEALKPGQFSSALKETLTRVNFFSFRGSHLGW